MGRWKIVIDLKQREVVVAINSSSIKKRPSVEQFFRLFVHKARKRPENFYTISVLFITL